VVVVMMMVVVGVAMMPPITGSMCLCLCCERQADGRERQQHDCFHNTIFDVSTMDSLVIATSLEFSI